MRSSPIPRPPFKACRRRPNARRKVSASCSGRLAMIRRTLALVLIALLPAVGLAGCRGPRPHPALSPDGRPCVTAPELAGAHAVPLDAGNPVTVTLDADAACFEPSGGTRSTYAVFQLPDVTEPYLETG